ncbi:hypothetical protein D3P96_07750 [Weissella viridescens]|uniref:Uncharacterized protein n=1 Tax=Weissella viridescens TaxID=1629 RepID=A0A3P2RJ21_WEIVI|nr:hypothetical protein [Weissella viridescens]RRG17438.1 hypothetical protein D3P96_07750 [Weissella viridescens]
MAMTFDEAIKQINEYALDIETKALITTLIYGLRDTYEKTVKMTADQYQLFDGYYQESETILDLVEFDFGEDEFGEDAAGIGSVGEILYLELAALGANISRDDLLYAWLQPNSIEVIEEL